MLMDFKLDFQEHCKCLPEKVNKTVALERKYQNTLPRQTFLTIYKCFVKLILIMAILFMIKLLTDLFIKKLILTI